MRCSLAAAAGLSLSALFVWAGQGLAEPAKKKPAPDGGVDGGDAGNEAEASADAASDGDGGRVECIYGRLEDPHHGFVRCLSPDEVDASWLPPPPQAPDDAGADGGDAAVDAPPAEPPVVTIGKPKFTSGDVPAVVANLDKQRAVLAECVADNGGLSAAKGSIELSFLVRARGKAEGVGTAKPKAVPAAAAACMKRTLQNRWVGTPTVEPVGVTILLTLERKQP